MFLTIFQYSLITFLYITPSYSNTECVQVIGRLLCKNDQKRVIGSVIELWELDSPLNVTFTTVNNEDGQFNLDGCGQDHDWLPGIINRPEFYLRVRHRCNNRRNSTLFNINNNNTFPDEIFKIAGEQETKIVLPVFRKPTTSFINGTIGNSTIFDWHLQHPIELSDDEILIATTTRPIFGINGENYNFDEENLEGDK
uniref:Transthyretin-like protein 46 n=1 Tax=Meloidogyne hapla TaxID=6305 RepID=A0A1I8B6C0_MELHA